MVFNKLKLSRFCICLLLLLACLPITGCAKAEAHREIPTTTPEPTVDAFAPVVDNRPRVALTYDDGPSSITTKPIVDELNKYGYHATFFVVGNRVRKTVGQDNGAEAMKYAVQCGNEIGIHGFTHSANYASCSDDTYTYEIYETLEAIKEKLPNYEVRLMRAVGGSISAERIAESKFAVIDWSVDTEDWDLKKPVDDADTINKIVDNALKNIKDGDIILMHDIYNNTYEATVILLARLNEMGYNVVTVSELLGDDLQPGRLYRQAN